ncbi:MAG: cytochrome c biogenesis protein CcsA [Candidatus Aquicultor sp.]|nr:cytochrome c biogenesis protein CcsA [Candidatus Aquicultor sp.]
MEKLTVVVFWLALVCSVASSLAYIGNFASRAERRVHVYTALGTALASFLLLLAVIFIRAGMLGISQTAGPFTVRVIFAAFIIGVFLLIETLYAGKNPKIKALGMFVMPISVVLQYMAWHSYKLTEPLTEQLRNYWVGIHVTFAVLGYSAMTVALAMAIIYLLQERQLKNMRKKKPGKIFRKLPSLEMSDEFCHKAIAFSFTFLTLVIATGIIRAEMLPEWSQWYMDPKILMAIATWVVYGAYLFVRSTLGWQGKRSIMFAILGFIVAVFTYLIGNSSIITEIIPSMHRYGGGLG